MVAVRTAGTPRGRRQSSGRGPGPGEGNPTPARGRRTPGPEPTVPAPPGPMASMEAVRAREVLSDGQWHDYEELVRELCRLIPPGRAIRANDDARYRQALHRARAKGETLDAKPPRVRPVDPDRARESGARSLVRKMLHGAGYETRPATAVTGKQIRDPRAAAATGGTGG